MKLDTTKDGLISVWRIYQLAIIELLAKGTALGSGAIHRILTKNSIKISRAMVIQFLNSMCDQGFASYTEQSGKGGFARIYKLEAIDLNDFHNKTVAHIFEHLSNAYKDILKIEWEILQ